MNSPKAVGMIFNKSNSDGVRTVKLMQHGSLVVIENAGNSAEFTIEDIDWLIACLQRIRNEVQCE